MNSSPPLTDTQLPTGPFWMASPTTPTPSIPCSPLSVPSVPILPFFTPMARPATFLAPPNSPYPHPFYQYYTPPLSAFLPRQLARPIPTISTTLPAQYLLPMRSALSTSACPTLSVDALISHPSKETRECSERCRETSSIVHQPNAGPVAVVMLQSSAADKGASQPTLLQLPSQTESADFREGSTHFQDPALSGTMADPPSVHLPGEFSRKKRDTPSVGKERKDHYLTKNYQAMYPYSSFLSSIAPGPPRVNLSPPKLSVNSTSQVASSNVSSHTSNSCQIPSRGIWHCHLTAAPTHS